MPRHRQSLPRQVAGSKAICDSLRVRIDVNVRFWWNLGTRVKCKKKRDGKVSEEIIFPVGVRIITSSDLLA